MGKQTMGTPVHTWRFQTNSKLYRLQTPTTPLFRPAHWDKINMDDFAMGTNAIVAVISYTVTNNLHLSFLARSGFNYIQLGIRYGRCNGYQSGFTSAWICSRSGLYFENYRLERT